MIIECCSQEKTFVRYYALLGARFCMLRREFQVGTGAQFVLSSAMPSTNSVLCMHQWIKEGFGNCTTAQGADQLPELLCSPIISGPLVTNTCCVCQSL
jgi:hypothetical protein